ncbi:MAG TPA: tetratricopeptide repeat protein [Usitatibacter sp.]|nr:tetratricopeptide repeat protein [Usitatibacter sp.]
MPVDAPIARVRELLARRDLDAAASLAQSLLATAAGDPDALFIAGVVAAERGALAEARSLMGRSLAIRPVQPPANHLVYANVLLDSREAALAEAQARLALAASPAWPAALATLAQALWRQERIDEAIAACDAAIAADPGYARARSIGAAARWTRARSLHAAARVFDAIDEYRASLALDDASADKWNDLGIAFTDAGRIDEAQAAYREALRRDPLYHQVESNLLICLHYDPSVDARRMYEAHRAWAARHAPRSADPPPRRAISPREPIRIGFISPALREGPTGAFLAPLLENLDRRRFAVHCYRTAGSEDAVTVRLRAASAQWRDVVAQDDDALFACLRGDALDVLVDLAGHTPGGRLPVLARKPAPIVATWLDYFDTNGIDAIDFLVGDPVSTPPGGAQRFSESVSLIEPCRLCYSPPAYAPPVAPAPATRNGCVTFGSFNRLSKLAGPVIDLWARVLRAAPGSRLLLKNGALADPRSRMHIEGLFAARGIAAERLVLQGESPHPELLAGYGDVDIALDPFPYNGGLTTCEALWMGVPVLGLLGDSMISRQTAALLGAAGFPQWVAGSGEALVALAADLAGNPARLAETRAGLRPALVRSDLLNAKRFAQNFANAVEGWVRTGHRGA